MTDILEHFFYEDQKPSEHTVLPYRSRLDSSHQTQISEKKHCAGIQCLHTSNHYSRQIRLHILHIDRLSTCILPCKCPGLYSYQRNHRPFIGAVSDYAGTIGAYMTDATVADIYIVSRITRKPIGRPIIYTMVDAFSNLIKIGRAHV